MVALFAQLVTGELSKRDARNESLFAEVLQQSPDSLVSLGRHSREQAQVVYGRSRLLFPLPFEQFTQHDEYYELIAPQTSPTRGTSLSVGGV